MSEKTSEEVKDSNELLNIIMMILGILFIIQGVLNILSGFNILPPAWLSGIAEGEGSQAAMALLGQGGYVSTILGVWCFIAGVGMMREQEWAWGQALVVLTIMCANSVGVIIGWISTPATFEIASFVTWISLIGLIVAILGTLWLIFTKERYA